MKTIFIMFALGGIILCAPFSGLCGNMEDARRDANSAYDYSGRASTSGNLHSSQQYSRQAMSASGDARDSAMGARSSDAAGYAGQAYDYSMRASRAQNEQDARHYSRQAEKAAQDAQSSIDYDIAKRRADKIARDAEENERIKSELAKKRAEEAIAEIEPSADNETKKDTVENKITGIFGR